MTKIVLDAESFKALASDTRLQILKALDARPLTVSELGRLLSLNKATVFEHLKQLMTAELAKREEDPARKWVYYKLTWKGRNVLHPENAQIFLMLGLGALGLGAGILQTAYLLQLRFGGAMSSAADPGPSDTNFADAEGSRVNDSVGAPPQAPAAQSSGPTATSAGSGQPAAGQTAPAATTSQQEKAALGEGGDGGQSPPDQRDEGGISDALANTSLMTMAALVVFLILIALLVWALRQDQARERARIGELIDQLPVDVNAHESVS